MNELVCEEFSQFFPVYAELADLRSTFIANCVFNNFLSYTAIMLNIVTIYAIHKTSTMAKTLKTLLLSLACSDVAVGLFIQPSYTFFLIQWLHLKDPGCNAYRVLSISGSLFSAASYSGVVAASVDRFLALHFHLRYQELVTHRRVVIVVIGIWVYSAFVSLMRLWRLDDTWTLIFVSAAFCLILAFVFYIRIYLTVQRHKIQMQSVQIQNEAQSDEMKNFAVLIKSKVGIFHVYVVFIVCCLPVLICIAVIRIYDSSIVLKKLFLFSLTLAHLNSSLNPVIYCWKIRNIRQSIMNVLRNVSWRINQPFRINYHRSASVVHIEN